VGKKKMFHSNLQALFVVLPNGFKLAGGGPGGVFGVTGVGNLGTK